ncbi:Protein of unknown function DUF1188 [Methanothermus fervidus DSM 2088]|uniref:Uncharacterized protein n=1 Tax=Methanothermus fervidus (strain ATCC 43054 / DSM 2088 / JCM 10308 / V24 S) TaxID=523846 RepID=E3GZ37_METFV|nr:DUF1188 domain-containing protein [Methanothermus fervidus]ADP77569.1 Protein of unknown function DUF1188 [Methanothermus fervidus DSM 2088]
MKNMKVENGITPTVKTYYSEYTFHDIIKYIGEVKTKAVIKWLKEKKLKPKNCLIIGGYITGSFLANNLNTEITLVDIHPQVINLVEKNIEFKIGLDGLRKKWDLIIDTTGIGGIENLNKFYTKAFIIEDPRSDGSDKTIRKIGSKKRLIDSINAKYKAFLYTYGLQSKTSGTMTLTIEVLKNVMNYFFDVEGVLYCMSPFEFYEGMLFKENNFTKFMKKLKKHALIVSSLRPVSCDKVIEKFIKKIKSKVIEIK